MYQPLLPSSRHSSRRSRAEIALLVGPGTAVVIGQFEVCLLNLQQADSNCRRRLSDDGPTVLQQLERRRRHLTAWVHQFLSLAAIFFPKKQTESKGVFKKNSDPRIPCTITSSHTYEENHRVIVASLSMGEYSRMTH